MFKTDFGGILTVAGDFGTENYWVETLHFSSNKAKAHGYFPSFWSNNPAFLFCKFMESFFSVPPSVFVSRLKIYLFPNIQECAVVKFGF